MQPPPDEVARRILFLLHWGLTEIRNLALEEGNEQIADLADALEILPHYVNSRKGEDIELVRFVLKTYQEKYPQSRYDYLNRFEKYAVPEHF